MPIEELLAMYGYNRDAATIIDEGEDQDEEDDEYNDNNDNSREATSRAKLAAASLSNQSTSQKQPSFNSSSSNHNVPSTASSTSSSTRLQQLINSDFSSSESDDDEYSANEEDWRHTIQVGSDYQAVVPEGLCHYNDEKKDEKIIETRGFVDQNRDILVWKPVENLKNSWLDEYVQNYEGLYEDEQTIPLGGHSKDDDQALYLLFKCGYNVKEAMQRHERCPDPPADSTPIRKMMSPWTEEECRNFEDGLRIYGKDFFTIKQTKIPTRTVGEVVTFYYFWKKTERHDTFMKQQKALEKKKYALHPGTT